MKISEKEITPVIYNMAAVKSITFEVYDDDPLCFRMHWHERMEILRIRKGKIKIDFGTFSSVFKEGEVVIIHPNQLHKGTLIGEYVKYDTFMFDLRSFYNDTDVCKKYLPPVFDGKTRFMQSTDNKDIISCIDSAIACSSNGTNNFYITSLIYKLFALLYENCLIEESKNESIDKSIQEVVEFIEKNYSSDLTTEKLSTHFKYSKPYFCRKFKDSTGLSPMNYIKILRVEKAYKFLKNGENDVSEISVKCGFTDPNYFTRCFKAHFGFPPSHYIIKNK